MNNNLNKNASFQNTKTVNEPVNTVEVKNSVIASALLFDLEFSHSQLCKIDLSGVDTTKANHSRDAFIINRALEYSALQPKKSTLGLTAQDIAVDYYDHLINAGADDSHAQQQSDIIEGKKRFRKPSAPLLTRELSRLDVNNGVHDSDWIDNWALLVNGDYFSIVDGVSVGTKWFNNKVYHSVPANVEGKPQEASNYVKGKIQGVHGVAYNPTKNGIFKEGHLTFANTYKYFEHGSDDFCDVKGAGDLINSHLKHLFNNDTDIKFMLDWLAWQVQRTGDLVGYCPLILGTQGDGKTTLGRILAAAIGDRNCKEVKNSSIKENWNAWANGSAVAFIEEIRATGRDRFDIYNEIKPLFTNAVVSIRGMNTSPIDVVNVTNYIAFTNHNDAVPIDDNDRRFHIMETAFCGHPFPQESYQEYFIDLYDAIEANAKGIYRFLNDYEISDRFCTERTPPKSEAKARMINNALSSGAQGILERIESLGDSILLDGCVSTILLKQRDNPINFENELPQTKAIAFAMAELGYIKQQVRPRFGGIRHTIYKKK